MSAAQAADMFVSSIIMLAQAVLLFALTSANGQASLVCLSGRSCSVAAALGGEVVPVLASVLCAGAAVLLSVFLTLYGRAH